MTTCVLNLFVCCRNVSLFTYMYVISILLETSLLCM